MHNWRLGHNNFDAAKHVYNTEPLQVSIVCQESVTLTHCTQRWMILLDGQIQQHMTL